MIRVFAMNIKGHDFEAPKWDAYLSEARRAEAEKRKQPKNRQSCLAAEVLLNLALKLLDKDISIPAVYERNSHGKPYLSPDCGIYVNWSHSGDYVLCAVADREVGVDIQETLRIPSDSLVRKVLTQEEKIFYESCREEEQKECFYQYWVLKESFLKALGTGFYTSLEKFQMDLTEHPPRIVQNINEKHYACRLLELEEEGYIVGICSEGALDEITVEYI